MSDLGKPQGRLRAVPGKPRNYIDDFDEENASALISLLQDPLTDPRIRLQIINEILEASKADSFFETMHAETLSLGSCPNCQHETHWLIPEEDLNVMGWISHEKDPRVPVHTNEAMCEEFAEACSKKKTTA